MRSREEIQEEILESNAEKNGSETVRLLQLEILLDIRDQQNDILDAVYDIEKTIDRTSR